MATQDNRLKILLVEGNHRDRLTFRRAMKKSGMDCDIVELGLAEEALSVLKNPGEIFDAAVVDLVLPDMPGLELYRKVKDKPGLPPFLVLADRSSMESAAKALMEGVDDYLGKEPARACTALLPLVLTGIIERRKDKVLGLKAEEAFKNARNALEEEVRRCTARLLRANSRLKVEIEERKRLENDLRQNEERFTLFTDYFPGMVYLKDEQGRLLYLNRYIEDAYGVKVEECIGRTDIELRPMGIFSVSAEDDKMVLSSGAEFQKMEDVMIGDRHVSLFTRKFRIMRNDSSRLIGGISLDVSRYRHTELQNRLLVSAFEHTTEGVFILDSKGIIQYLNPAAEHSLEVPGHEPAGTPFERFIAPEAEQAEAFSLKDIGDKPWRGSILRTRTDGTNRELDIIISPVGDESGRIMNYAVIEHDVTEEKALQKALERKRRIEALGLLAGGIAHDFINILQPILINAELVSDALPHDTPEREFLNQIIEAARIGKEITNQIKMFGSRKKQVFKPVPIEPVVRDALKIIEKYLPAHIMLRRDITPTAAKVRTEPSQFYQLLTNLCMNAVQAMNEGPGTLAVTLSETRVREAAPAFVSILNPGEYLLLTVSDTGCGMMPEVMEQIFDPLFSTRKSSKGTGLGLGVVHAVVKNAGGSVIVHSTPGKGSSFEVYFPPSTEALGEAGVEVRDLAARKKGRVLLVDDNILELRSIHQMLVRMGYRVASTHDSLKAIDLFRQTPKDFDLIITDQLMPAMNGSDMASRMREVRGDLPVVVCSGSEEALQGLKEHSEPLTAYLPKPFSSHDLGEAIDLLARP